MNERLKRQRQLNELSPVHLAFLTDQEDPTFTPEDNFFLWCLRHGFPELGVTPEELWFEHWATFLPQFITQNPCKRPLPWWTYEAPEPRQRIGGSGVPNDDGGLERGLPFGWCEDPDPEDPPVYESEAAYLKRHGLLTKMEIRWLETHPELMDHETIHVDPGEADDA